MTHADTEGVTRLAKTVSRLDPQSRQVVATLAAAIADPVDGAAVTARIGKIIDREYPTREAWRTALFAAILGAS